MRPHLSTLSMPGRALTLLAGALAAACTVSGHAPLWMLPVWALALGLWCLNERRRSVALALPVVLALLPAWPHLADLLAFSGLYLRVALSGLAAALFVQTLDEQGNWWGLIALALAWVLAPTPLGVFGLLAAALLRAQAVQRGHQLVTQGRALGWLLAGAALVALLSSLLPAVAPWPVDRAARPAVAAQSGAAPEPTTQAQVPPPARPAFGFQLPRYALPDQLGSFTLLDRVTPLLLLAFAALTFTLLVRVWRERRQGLGRPRLTDLLLVAALAVGAVMVFLYALARSGGGTSGASGPTTGGGGLLGLLTGSRAPVTPAPPGLVGFLNALGWLGVGSALLFIGLAVVGVLWLIRSGQSAGSGSASATASSGTVPDLPPEHRVRRAYRQMLAALEAAGVARRASETPQEYLARLAGERPELAGETRTVTEVYEPVRYGAQTDERGARAAEDALGRLRARLEGPA